MSVGQITDFLWEDQPPASATNTVHTYIKHLRALLEPDRPRRSASRVLRTVAGGYLLDVDPASIDLMCFRKLLMDGRTAEALATVGGLPLAGLGVREFPQIAAVERELIEAAVAAGPVASAVTLLEELAAAHRLHEPLHAALMSAYRRTGRSADALALFERIRTRLREELGVDPAAELRQAHLDTLNQPTGWLGRKSPAEELVGRTDQITWLAALVSRHRMITLTGPGGVGKTTLALAAANTIADTTGKSVVVVELGGLPPGANEDAVTARVLVTLGTQLYGRESALEAAVRSLRGDRLVVLDNAEHVLPSCSAVAEHLVRASADISLLTTSRTPLRLSGETVVDVPPLTESHAIELLHRRVAQSHRDAVLDEHQVVRLCRQLDGLPLAIELAAGRLRSLDLDTLLDRLRSHANLLSAPRPLSLEHQRSLASTLQWSFDLLNLEQRILLTRLSVFAGTFSLEAAEEICGSAPLADVLGSLSDLVDHSLVKREADGYRLLVPIRDHAMAAASADEIDDTRNRHFARYARLVGELESMDPDERAARVLTLRAAIPEVHAALEWAIGATGPLERGVLLLAGARSLWDNDSGELFPVARVTDLALARIDQVSAATRVRLLHWAGRLEYTMGKSLEAGRHLSATLDLLDPDDQNLVWIRLDVLLSLAGIMSENADPLAMDHVRTAINLAREHAHAARVIPVLAELGGLLVRLGNPVEAEAALAEAERLAGDSRTLRHQCLRHRVVLATLLERHDDVGAIAAELLTAENAGLASPVVLASTWWSLSMSLALRGHHDAARDILIEGMAQLTRIGLLVATSYLGYARAVTEFLAERPADTLHAVRAILRGVSPGHLVHGVRALNVAAAEAVRSGSPNAPAIVAHARRCRELTLVASWPFTAEDCAAWEAAGEVRLPPHPPGASRSDIIIGSFAAVEELLG